MKISKDEFKEQMKYLLKANPNMKRHEAYIKVKMWCEEDVPMIKNKSMEVVN